MLIKQVHYIEHFYQLKELTWAGGYDTLAEIEDNNKEEEFIEYINSIFGEEEEIEDTKFNDFLWFDREQIFEDLGIKYE